MNAAFTQWTLGATTESTSLPPRRRAVLLINLGTPDGTDVPSVRRYLSEFLSDPAVIRLPSGLGWLNRPLGGMIALMRSPKSAEMYRRIWTDRGSPLMTITQEQALALQEALPRGWRVYFAMRYGRPAIVDTLQRIEADGMDELVVLPMYPQFSWPSTGTALRVVYDYFKTEGAHLDVTTHTSWYADTGYVNAQAELIQAFATEHDLTADDTYLLFSTHGLPVSYVRRGDPYADHVRTSVALVVKRLGWPNHRTSLAFQSRLGPVKWIKPYTDEMLTQLARGGEKKILVCPISFTADCLETIEEIGMRYAGQVENEGGRLFVCPSLNTYGPFIAALKHLVLSGPRTASGNVAAARAERIVVHEPRSTSAALDGFVMIGASVPGRLGPGRGPRLRHVEPETLRRMKKPQCEVPRLLRSLRQKSDVGDAWLWNTCHRFELYGWLRTGGERNGRAVDAAKRLVFGETGMQDVNVLRGVDAWHHLVRTAAGLNSCLPGERDVLEQLHAAHRLASHAGAAGPCMDFLLKKIDAVTQELRTATPWGRFHPQYAHAATARIIGRLPGDIRSARIVVVGGSTTSASVLSTLIERFEVPSRQLTLLYRGHKRGGQLKVLRRAIRQGRRIRVQSYAEQTVVGAIEQADVVFFGVDQTTPVLDAQRLSKRRDFRTHPLSVFDFNVYGSTVGLNDVPGVSVFDANRLEREVSAHADALCGRPDFDDARRQAEAWIVEQGLEALDAPRPSLDRRVDPTREKRVDPVTEMLDRRRWGGAGETRGDEATVLARESAP